MVESEVVEEYEIHNGYYLTDVFDPVDIKWVPLVAIIGGYPLAYSAEKEDQGIDLDNEVEDGVQIVHWVGNVGQLFLR